MTPKPSALPPKPEAFPGVATLGPSLERLALRFDDLPALLGVSRRTLERERSAGRFPRPDLTIGRMPLWRPETIREWVERGGKP